MTINIEEWLNIAIEKLQKTFSENYFLLAYKEAITEERQHLKVMLI